MDQVLAPLKAGKAHGSSHERKSGLGKLKEVLDGMIGRCRGLKLLGHTRKCSLSAKIEDV